MSEKVEILTEDQAVKELAYPIEVKVYEEGVQLIPSSATITVKNPSGTKQVEDQSVTVDSNIGTMIYSLAATYTAKLWENAVIEISYVVSSVTYKAVFLFDVVLNKLKCSVVDYDLKGYYPKLENEIWDEQITYDPQIQEAFKIVKRDIKDKGKRPAMLIDGMQIREIIILKTFELIFFDFIKEEGDKWWIRHQDSQEKYRDRFAKLTIKYDVDESSLIEEDEAKGVLGQVTLER